MYTTAGLELGLGLVLGFRTENI